MTQCDSTAEIFGVTIDDVASQASACALLMWFPAILTLLNRLDAAGDAGGSGEWIATLILTVVSPLDLAFRLGGLEGGLLHGWSQDIAAMVVTATLAYLPCLALGLVLVVATHGVTARVRGGSPR